MRAVRVLIVALCIAGVFVGVGRAASPGVWPAPKPENGIDGLLRAFETHDLVAIGEYHGSTREHVFLRRLIADPRFAATVRDIVVEFGNARYQRLADRWIVDGVTFKHRTVAPIWSLTTQRGHAWLQPIYPAFFEAVRRLNRSLPKTRRLRVLLGDPAIDWTKIRQSECDKPTPSCLDYWLSIRDESYSSVVEDQVLARGHKALLIAGGYHVIHEPWLDPGDATALIERQTAQHVFVVLPHNEIELDDPTFEKEVESWPNPSLAVLAGTSLGNIDAAAVLPDGIPGLRDTGGTAALAEIADAYLYIGRL
jgi:hypothetical protein